MSCKIRIRFGEVEVEYEGPEPFLKEELPELLKVVSTLHATRPKASNPGVPSDPSDPNNSVTTIARRLAVTTGPGLISAAALALTRRGKLTFSKKEIRAEMKSASAYFRKTYLSNLDNCLDSLTKSGKILDAGGDIFSLPESEKATLNSKTETPA